MKTETNSTNSSPSGKRSRDPEDEVYVDNLHSHKRYLSEMMASSLNGLSVGDSVPETTMGSPARSESMLYPRDEMSLQYSPMSEDLDDARYCETPMSACSSQSESRPSSPVSPYRYYKPVGVSASSCSPPSTSHGCNVTAFPSSEPRQSQRGSDTEGRFPSSPSDICHSSDLRKTALLRSVQMRTQPSCSSSSFDLGFTGNQHSEVETRSCSYLKPMEYHVENCSSMGSSESVFPPTQLSLQNNEAEMQSCSYMKPLDEEREYHVERCSSEPVFTESRKGMLSIEAEPPLCSFMKPLDDGPK